jgi:hypothetical protein
MNEQLVVFGGSQRTAHVAILNKLARYSLNTVLVFSLSIRPQDADGLRPSLAGKRLHPHSMRRNTAIHLLKSGIADSTIANWLRHAKANTTNKCEGMDLNMGGVSSKLGSGKICLPAGGDWKRKGVLNPAAMG